MTVREIYLKLGELVDMGFGDNALCSGVQVSKHVSIFSPIVMVVSTEQGLTILCDAAVLASQGDSSDSASQISGLFNLGLVNADVPD